MKYQWIIWTRSWFFNVKALFGILDHNTHFCPVLFLMKSCITYYYSIKIVECFVWWFRFWAVWMNIEYIKLKCFLAWSFYFDIFFSFSEILIARYHEILAFDQLKNLYCRLRILLEFLYRYEEVEKPLQFCSYSLLWQMPLKFLFAVVYRKRFSVLILIRYW